MNKMFENQQLRLNISHTMILICQEFLAARYKNAMVFVEYHLIVI